LSKPTSIRCDLHLHSTASANTDEWYSKHFGCSESYASPRTQYELCKKRGMSLVTLTDHDTIAGGLELLDRPDFFLSEEVTTHFPENSCTIHVLAWNITPAQHDRIQAVRANVYDLVDYLRCEHVAHACAHPLVSTNWKLDAETLEKMLVLFPVLEGTNGLTDRRIAQDLHDILAGANEASIAMLARKHALALAPVPYRGGLTAGSDDHAHRICGSCFTEVDGAGGAGELFEAVMGGESRACGQQADLNTMHMTVANTTYHFMGIRRTERPDYRDPFVDLVDVLSGREKGDQSPTSSRDEFVRSLLAGAARSVQPLGPELCPEHDAAPSDEINTKMMEGVARIHDGLVERAVEELIEGIGDLDMYRMLGALRDVAGSAMTVLPFLFSADHFAKEHRQSRAVAAQWTAWPLPPRTQRMAIFSDSIENVDGVAASLQRFVKRAQDQGREVRIPYCGDRPRYALEDPSYQPLAKTASYDSGLYQGMKFHLPSLLGTIDWLWRQEITHVELATPGPMGLVGLLAARLMRLPVTASYHTEVPEMVRQLSSNVLLHATSRRLLSWFYGRVDRVFAFSEASRARLVDMGVAAAKIELMPVAIDPGEFSPQHVSPSVYEELGVRTHGRPVVLSVGRLSKEKNIPLIIEAVAQMQSRRQPPVLVIVGDGPERKNLVELCRDKPYVALVGMQEGQTLKQLYATADAFVFASQIDTLGLVTMEAMSSGVAVLVPQGSAGADLVTHGNTGYSYEFGLAGLIEALTDVLGHPERRAEIAANGRRQMVDRWRQVRFDDVWTALART
jgi:glycosyltransferase involved in cell wall biosynthesis